MDEADSNLLDDRVIVRPRRRDVLAALALALGSPVRGEAAVVQRRSRRYPTPAQQHPFFASSTTGEIHGRS